MIKDMIIFLLCLILIGVADADYMEGPFCPLIGLKNYESPEFEIHADSWTVHYDIDNLGSDEDYEDYEPDFEIWVYDTLRSNQIDYLSWHLKAGEVPVIGPNQNSNYDGPGRYKIKIQMPPYFKVCMHITDHHSS